MAEGLNMNTALGAVNLFMSSVKNCRLYPESSDIVEKSLDSGYKRLEAVFYRDDPFVVSEAEGSTLFDGKLLEPRSQRMPQIVFLRQLMENLNLRSIAFDPGIDRENYAGLCRILSMVPEEVEALGGIRDVLATQGISFVTVNHKTFVAAEYDAIIASDEELFRDIWSGRDAASRVLGYITHNISNKPWLKSLSRNFLNFIADKGFVATDREAFSSLAKLSGYLIKAGMARGDVAIFKTLYSGLETLGPYFNCDALALNLSDKTVLQAVEGLDDASFQLLSARLLLMKRNQRRGSRLVSGADMRPYVAAADWLVSLPRGIEFKIQIDEVRKREEVAQKKELARIEVLIERLMAGDTKALDDTEALAALPRGITERVQLGRVGEAEKLIQASSLALSLDDEKKSMAAVRILLQSARAFISLDRREMVGRVLGSINLWARYQQEVTPLFEAATDMMVNHIHHLVVSSQFVEAIPVVETFSLIETGRLKKHARMTQYAEKTLRRMASDRVFNIIMAEFRSDEKGQREHAANLLVQLGKISVSPLLDLLRESSTMAERIRTIGLLQNIGPACLGELTERIKPDTVWFYLRNLLKILGAVGGEEHVGSLEPLVQRSEAQVLDAVISCVKQIGGAKRSRFFSKAILQVPNPIKPRLAGLLAQSGGEEAVYALSRVLKSKPEGAPEERDLVIRAVCRALGEIGSMRALPALQLVIEQKGLLGRSQFTPEQKKQAEEMILKIRNANSQARTSDVQTEQDIRGSVTREYIAGQEFNTLEEVVRGLISRGKKIAAVKMLLLMVERAAREKDFLRAEGYKTQISEVDELALGEVVRAGEMIEQEKRFVDSGEYMETWKALYEVFTEAEASSFYYHLVNEVVDVDTEIISQGEVINRLYFINSGSLKISFKDGPKEIFVKEMGKGEVAGYDAFFHTNVSTTSLVALSRVNVGYLERESLKVLAGRYPNFAEKLQAFCSPFDNLSETIQAKGVERRRYKRFDVHGRVVLQLLTDQGTSVGKAFSGAMIDLSEGGLSAEVKSSGYNMARLLLGRPISTLMKPGEEAENFSVQGRVNSVNARGKNAISIHIAFARPMDVAVLETFVAS